MRKTCKRVKINNRISEDGIVHCSYEGATVRQKESNKESILPIRPQARTQAPHAAQAHPSPSTINCVADVVPLLSHQAQQYAGSRTPSCVAARLLT